MEQNDSNEKAVVWYTENRKLYQQLSNKVESIIRELIDDEKIAIHDIYSRTKEINSFSKKIEDRKYNSPLEQTTDLSGIRIIAYVENDLDKISDIIKSHFNIDEKNSIDKSKSLGTDKVGYRSMHYVAQIHDDRLLLPEYKKFKNLNFEIQIRTILQHSWAEIEHDKNYKFSGQIPEHLKRRFSVLAGVLELADREFDSIAKEIDLYSESVNKDTKKGNLEILIDSTSIKSYVSVKFDSLIKKGVREDFPTHNSEKNVLEELKNYEIYSLKDFDKIIPKDFIKRYEKIASPVQSIAGVIRHVLIVNDAKKYFENAWNNHWPVMNRLSVDFIKEYLPNLESILKEYGIGIKDK